MHEITAKRGDFTLFALFRRANGLGGWDLVVAAPWLEAGRLKAIGKVIDLVTKSIGKRWLQQLARVEVVDSDDPTVKLLASTPVEDGERRLVNTDLFGLQIEEAIILRAKDRVRKRRPARHWPHRALDRRAAAGEDSLSVAAPVANCRWISGVSGP
jgi:hypothetical protein